MQVSAIRKVSLSFMFPLVSNRVKFVIEKDVIEKDVKIIFLVMLAFRR